MYDLHFVLNEAKLQSSGPSRFFDTTTFIEHTVFCTHTSVRSFEG